MTALKPADDGRGYIARFADRHGRGGAGELVWQGERFAIALSPFQVATLRLVKRDGAWHCEACDMLERPLARTGPAL
jgi:hypothetical protein